LLSLLDLARLEGEVTTIADLLRALRQYGISHVETSPLQVSLENELDDVDRLASMRGEHALSRSRAVLCQLVDLTLSHAAQVAFPITVELDLEALAHG